ncbi:MAG: SH3 domain-containing protein [Chloroflexota bacterium]|nr:MAG: hypothetical protein DIU68_12910 [Chloroflexota bacterium]
MLRILFTGLAAGLILLVCVFASTTVQAQDEPCSEPLPLVIGQNIYTRPGVFIRNLPSLSGARVGYYPSSITLRVTGSPVCADGYNWWPVEGPGNPGWIAEGKPDFRLIFPDDTYVVTNDCAPPLALPEGAGLRVINGARVRAVPGAMARVLAYVGPNTLLSVRGQPECVGGINWWPVWTPAGGEQFAEGWIAESDDGLPVVEPNRVVLPGEAACAPPYRRLGIGVRAVVTYRDDRPKNLRAAPGRDAPVLNTLLKNVAVDIIGGPECRDGLNWWQIRVVGIPETVGWMAEGGTAAGGYWLLPIGLE